MKVTFLGTGTSHGVPVIGCGCKTCLSKNKKNKRNRASVLIEKAGKSLLIDMTAEFRLRSLEYGIKKIDAVLFTHAHADHTAGVDDIRRYNELQGSQIPFYGNMETIKELKQRFKYIFDKTQEGGGKPRVKLSAAGTKNFKAGGLKVTPLPVLHGNLKILGYRIDNFAYITDVSAIPEKTFSLLKGLDVLVLDALRHTPHPTHFSLSEAVQAAGKIGAKKTYFTHISHAFEHTAINKTLPRDMKLAFDGQVLEI